MFPYLFIFLLVFSATPLFPYAVLAESSFPPSAFDEGIRLKNEGKLEQAERSLKHTLERDPANADAHFELANIYAIRYDERVKRRDEEGAKSSLEEAERELEQAVMLAPDFTAARFNLGVVTKRQGKFEEARSEFKRLLETDPNQIQVLMQIGSTYEEQGFFDEAKNYYRQALERDVTNSEIRSALEDLERRKEETKEKGGQVSDLSPFFHSRFRNGFPYSPHSQAAQYEAGRQAERAQGQGLQQAIPYLGAWLIQEFMKRKANTESQ